MASSSISLSPFPTLPPEVTSDLAAVFGKPSRMASSSIREGLAFPLPVEEGLREGVCGNIIVYFGKLNSFIRTPNPK
jgi:hypothetical protein